MPDNNEQKLLEDPRPQTRCQPIQNLLTMEFLSLVRRVYCINAGYSFLAIAARVILKCRILFSLILRKYLYTRINNNSLLSQVSVTNLNNDIVGRPTVL